MIDVQGIAVTDDLDVAAAAVWYAGAGLRVVAVHGVVFDPEHDGHASCTCAAGATCRSGQRGKHPIAPGWQNNPLASDVDTVADTYRRHPHANVGLMMGGPMGLIAIDVDGEKGRATLAQRERELGPLPATLTSRSGRADGGEHRIYALPPAVSCEAVRNSTGQSRGGLGPGLDVRAEGGQIVAPPSLHESGARYAWLDARNPAELPEAWARELPGVKAWLAEREGAAVAPSVPAEPPVDVAPAAPPSTPRDDWQQFYARRVLESACAVLQGTPKGDRNNSANREAWGVGGYLWTGAFTEEQAYDAMLAATRAGGWDKDPEPATMASLRRGLRDGAAQPREVPAKQARVAMEDERPACESEPRTRLPIATADAASGSTDRQHSTPPPPSAQRLIIKIDSAELPRMVQESIAALRLRDSNLFQRSGELVTIAREPEHADPPCAERASEREPCPTCAASPGEACFRASRHGSNVLLRPGTPRIRAINAPTLTERLAAAATWLKYDRESEDWIPTGPHGRTVAIVAARSEGWPGIRPIRGILEAPSLRPDGSIIATAGYDAATGYVYLPSCGFPDVSEEPTQAEAAEALRRLWIELFCDFPYQGLGEAPPNWRDVDPLRHEQYERARGIPDAFVGITSLLTVVARPAIKGAVPGAVFEAATQGSGKTLQINGISVVATGRPAGLMTYPASRHGDTNDEELEKVLASYALAGARVVAFDNVKCALGGPALEKYMTTPDTVDARVLGASDLRTLPWSGMILVSGNNVTMNDDVAQRTLLSRLESPREDPRGRDGASFRTPDLLATLAERRPALVADALTVIRAYIVARGRGETPSPATLGSFEAWSRLIPPAIAYAGGPDVMRARPRVGEAALDAEGEAHVQLLRGWPTDAPIKAADLLKILFEHEQDIRQGAAPDGREMVRGAVRSLTRTQDGRAVNVLRFSKALQGLRGKIRQGLQIAGAADRTGVTLWEVRRVS